MDSGAFWQWAESAVFEGARRLETLCQSVEETLNAPYVQVGLETSFAKVSDSCSVSKPPKQLKHYQTVEHIVCRHLISFMVPLLNWCNGYNKTFNRCQRRTFTQHYMLHSKNRRLKIPLRHIVNASPYNIYNIFTAVKPTEQL